MELAEEGNAVIERKRYMMDSYIVEDSDRYQESHLMVSGAPGEEFTLLVIGDPEMYTFYYFSLVDGADEHPRVDRFKA
jgi:hypothetical protein